jgi:hypothetical protein
MVGIVRDTRQESPLWFAFIACRVLDLDRLCCNGEIHINVAHHRLQGRRISCGIAYNEDCRAMRVLEARTMVRPCGVY